MIVIHDVENLQLKLHKYQISFRGLNDCLFAFGTPEITIFRPFGHYYRLFTDILLVTPDQI